MNEQINLGKKQHERLRDLFPEVSRQTIFAALRYFSNSQLAQTIRANAIKILEDDLTKAKENELKINKTLL